MIGFRISPVQERIWTAGNNTIRLTTECTVACPAPLDIERVEQAARRVVGKYEILRTRYVVEGGRRFPLQVVIEDLPPVVIERSVSDSLADPDKLDTNGASNEGILPLRVDVVRDDAANRLVLAAPAISCDAHTLQLIAAEMLAEIVEGTSADDEEEILQYAQYAEWSRQFADEPDEEALAFWKRHAAPVDPLALSWRAPSPEFVAGAIPLPIEADVAAAIHALAEGLSLSSGDLLTSLWAAFLARIAKGESRSLAIDLAGREFEELQGVIGPIARSVSLSVPDADGEAGSFIAEFAALLAEARDASDYLLSPDDARFVPGQDVVAIEVIEPAAELPEGFRVESIRSMLRRCTLKLSCLVSGEGIAAELLYDASVMDPDSASTVGTMFTTFMRGVAENPSAPLAEQALLGESSLAALHAIWNASSAPFEEDVFTLIDRAATVTPDAVAVVDGDREHTFAELLARVGAFASALRAHSVSQGDVVALCLDRSFDAVAAMLGTVRCGAAFLPIDPALPAERRQFMAEDSGAKVVVIDGSNADAGSDHSWPTPTLNAEDVLPSPDDVERIVHGPDDIAYVIYTSGSTGMPKGCAIRRRNLANYIGWACDHYLAKAGTGANGEWPLFTSLSFDLTLTSIFCALVRGRRLHILGDNREMPDVLRAIFSPESSIDTVKMTPAQASLLPDLGLASTNVRVVILGGEQLRRPHVEALRALNPSIAIFNEYGPTETTVGCSVARIGDEDERITIGSPIAGTRLFVADADGRTLPPYCVGELWVSGAGVGAGYLNREETTAERFRTDMSFAPGDPAYRTGDLVRRYPDGTLEYLGRNDDQVKVKGYRIELEEVRSRIAGLDGVRDAVAIAMGEEETELAAYYVAESGIDESLLRSRLGEFLPEYMIPQYLVRVDVIPLTANGKVDRGALPDPRVRGEEREYLAPRDETEMRIVEIWRRVLGEEEVGVRDDFFRIGGHSLKAMRAVAQINDAFNVDLKVGAIFEHPTVEALAAIVRSATPGGVERIEPVADREFYELSDAQRRLWVLEQMEPLGDAYHVTALFDIEGESFDVGAFSRAFNTLVRRHESLRTTFHVVDGKPMQRIEETREGIVELIDLRGGDDAGEAAEKMAEQTLSAPFDLERDLPIRVRLFLLTADRYRLAVAIHHIVSDGWSVRILIDELTALYDAYRRNVEIELDPLPTQYVDYAVFQQERLEDDRSAGSRAYWLEKLRGARPVDLPLDAPRPVAKSYTGRSIRFALDEETTRGLHAIATATGSSLFMVLAALVKALLYRYTREGDVTVGTAIAGRDHPDLQNQVGFYVNLLALRDVVHGNEPFPELLRSVRDTATAAYEHSSYPFDRLVDEIGVERETGRSPLFDVFLVLQDSDTRDLRFGETKVTELSLPGVPAKYDLSFDLTERGDGIRCELVYDPAIFSVEKVERIASHFTNLAAAVAAPEHRDVPLSALPMLSDDEAREIVSAVEALPTGNNYPEELNRTLVEAIDEAASHYPDNVAVTDGERSLIYRELRDRANGVAAVIRERLPDEVTSDNGMGPRVAILLPRSEAIPLLLLGILKAGCVYVPVDPDYPEERVAAMLDAAGVALAVVDESWSARVAERGIPSLSVDDLRNAAPRADAPEVAIHPDSVATIFFTSGSTGRPKGVKLSHRGLVNTALGESKGFGGIRPTFRILLFASLSFDASLSTMLMALTNGAAIVVVDRDTVDDPSAFAEFLARNDVMCATLPPAYLATLNRTPLPSLRILRTAGESPVTGDATHYARALAYYNAYGPTECSICVSEFLVDPAADYSLGIPIGRELPNIHVVLLDGDGNLLPPGIDGEICVVGVGVGPGYLDAEQTAKSFVEHALFPGRRFYRTGDLGRRLFDGTLLFRGRLDEQVKVRGHRVEPEEIAVALREHPAVRDAAVVTRTGADSVVQLVACWVPTDDPSAGIPRSIELRAWLSERIPGYMIPSLFVSLSELPTTPNGKIDRARLLAEAERVVTETSGGEKREPIGEAEVLLTEAIAETLGVAKAWPEDNYFTIGGDSIKAIQLTWRLREAGYVLPVRELFSHPILAEAATRMKRDVAGAASEESVVGEIPLAPIQRWFFERFGVDRESRFNQSVLLKSIGERVDVESLRRALEAVVARHEALRTFFDLSQESVLQVVAPDAAATLRVADLSHDADAGDAFRRELETTHAPFDLTTPPLLRAALIRLPDRDYLHIVAHHLVIDLVSWEILVSDVLAAYAALTRSEEIAFPPKGAAYGTWTARLAAIASSNEAREWKEHVERMADRIASAGAVEVDASADNLYRDAEELSVTLDREATASLIADANGAYNTDVRDLLVAAFSAAWSEETGAVSCAIAVEGHGRGSGDRGEADVSRTIGWFTSLAPVLLHADEDRGRAIKSAKEELRALPGEGQGYGIARYMREASLPDLLAGPTQVVLNYLGVEQGDARAGSIGDLFAIGQEPAGLGMDPDARRPFEIEIVASVRDGELVATFTWSGARIARERIERLARGWMRQIAATVEHCLSIDAPELTPSDIDYAGLSIDDLDSLLAGIGG